MYPFLHYCVCVCVSLSFMIICTLLLCQFDGTEVLKQGASLYDLADWMVERGVYHAIVSGAAACCTMV